jgi:hypothetical protein
VTTNTETPPHGFRRNSPPTTPPRSDSVGPELPRPLPLLHNRIQSSPGHFPRRNHLTPSHPSPAPPELGLAVDSPHRCLFVQSKYGNCFSFAHWCSCARYFPAFAGPSPGTTACRHGRRISPSVPRFPCCPLYACTLIASLESHRPCPTGSSPPARTRRRLSGRVMSRWAGAYS